MDSPAVESLHSDSFLDEVLSLRVNQWQNWVLGDPVLGRHLLEGQAECQKEEAKKPHNFHLFAD